MLDFHKKKEALEATQTKIRGLELLGENLEQTLLRRQNAHHDFMKYIVLRLRVSAFPCVLAAPVPPRIWCPPSSPSFASASNTLRPC